MEVLFVDLLTFEIMTDRPTNRKQWLTFYDINSLLHSFIYLCMDVLYFSSKCLKLSKIRQRKNFKAINDEKYLKNIARQIKIAFDEKYGLTWHCIAGADFGSYVTHETRYCSNSWGITILTCFFLIVLIENAISRWNCFRFFLEIILIQNFSGYRN